jgi:hypothetical protein
MSRPNILAILAFVIGSALAVCSQQDQTKQGSGEYATLLAQVQGGDLSIDFQRLRFSYMDSPERHNAKDTSTEENGMRQALKDKDYKKALNLADVILANEFVNLDAHFIAYHACQGLNDASKADFHEAVFKGLVRSILNSGDGKTQETAYVVISADEEYIVLGVLGLRPGKQSLIHSGAHSYDLLEAIDQDTNKTVPLYFNVDIPFKHYLN